MKTIFTCLILIIIALIVGKNQSSHIDSLKQNVSSETSFLKPRPRITKQTSAYPNKYRQSSQSGSAQDILDEILSILDSKDRIGGWHTGPAAHMASQFPEVTQLIMQLSEPKLRELIDLLIALPDGQLDFGRGQQVCLCLIALSHLNPDSTIDLIVAQKKLPEREQLHVFAAQPLIEYTISHWLQHDHVSALEKLDSIIKTAPKLVTNDVYIESFSELARHDPTLSLQKIAALPDEIRKEASRSITRRFLEENEKTALYHALDKLDSSHTEVRKGVLRSLLAEISHTHTPLSKTTDWLTSLEMSDEQKHEIFWQLVNAASSSKNSPEFTDWLIDFFPESEEKLDLIALSVGGWLHNAPESGMAYLQAKGIDPRELFDPDFASEE